MIMEESQVIDMLGTSGNAIQFFIAYMLWKMSNDMQSMKNDIQTIKIAQKPIYIENRNV